MVLIITTASTHRLQSRFGKSLSAPKIQLPLAIYLIISHSLSFINLQDKNIIYSFIHLSSSKENRTKKMETNEAPLDDKAKRMRELLSSFYSPDPSKSPNSSNTSSQYSLIDDINSTSFDLDQYMNILVHKSSLEGLLQKHVQMAAEIKNLDTDLQMLVYENYNKFICATDTIKRMKSNILGMEGNMEHLLDKIMSVQSRSDNVNTSLFDKREHIEKLHRTCNLLRKIQFIYDLPDRLRKCIKSEAYADAVRFYTGSMPVFKKYGNSSFKNCKRASEKAIAVIIKNLQEKLLSDSESTEVRAESAALLKQLNFPVDNLKVKLLKKLEHSLIGVQLNPEEINNASPANHEAAICEFVEAVRAFRVIFPDSEKQLIKLAQDLVTKHFVIAEEYVKTRICGADLLGVLRVIWNDVLMLDGVLEEATLYDHSVEAAKVAIKLYVKSTFSYLLQDISGTLFFTINQRIDRHFHFHFQFSEMTKKPWRIIPRPLFETILHNHAHHHRVRQPLLLHGPRGVGKTTLILDRLLPHWNKSPHLTGYVDFASSIKNHNNNNHIPWSSTSQPPPSLSDCRNSLEQCLESMAEKGVQLGTITSQQIFSTLSKWHGLTAALRSVLQASKSKSAVSGRALSASALWDRAIFALSARCNATEINRVLGLEESGKGEKNNNNVLSVEDAAYFKESVVALKLAKKVIEVQQGWRANAIAHMNRTGVISRTLVHSSTDWPCLLLELLSQAAEVDRFQPKLVINNIEVLKHAAAATVNEVGGPLYHDSLIWRIVALGANVPCLPVILVTSDGYYSYEAFLEFGYKDLFISRETFGWTQQEAKMHMVADYFSHSEWKVIAEVLGPNPRHLFELYALKQNNPADKACSIEDIVDAYLAYLQITVVNPAMDGALEILQKFALDARNGKVSKDGLRFGAPWRHPPKIDDPKLRKEWAKLQLMDFVLALVNTEFGINYRIDYSEEIFDDPSTVALLEVGLLYAQRDPPFIRPISKGIQRCLVRWLVQQRLQLSYDNVIRFLWHRTIRGRYYRHLMVQL
ncbi:hypothetical protein RIF29_24828 [Crotalaria pallida]|uniref:Vacuolar protein sorting-associated protein 51 homolog n=1 Tax=Crotalaria pallida TaxID=3830 RepID=A0AAN9EL17_CROPI